GPHQGGADGRAAPPARPDLRRLQRLPPRGHPTDRGRGSVQIRGSALLDTAVVNGTLVTPGGVFAADVGIADGKIAAVARPGALPPAAETLDAAGRHVFPGVVDPHTHPGNFRPLADDVRSETRSAAVGGVTTMLGTVKCMRMG